MKPHLGHLYVLPNLRHLPSRLIWMSPQLGHMNFVDSVPGGMGLPQLVHVTSESVVLSVILVCSPCSVVKCWSSLYLLCSAAAFVVFFDFAFFLRYK